MATFTSKATGGWDTEGQTTWNQVGHPTTGDTVTINNGHTVGLESVSACNALTISTTGQLNTGGWAIDAGNTIVNGILNGTGCPQISVTSMVIGVAGHLLGGTLIVITGKNGSDIAWSNSHSYLHQNGIVDFRGQTGTHKILGDNTWFEVEISVTATCIYLFETAKTQTVQNHLHMTGGTNEPLWINSTTMAAAWLLNLAFGAPAQYIARVGVMWSDASPGATVLPLYSQDCGYNTNWSGWTIPFGNTNRGAGAAGAAAAAASASAPGISGTEAEYQAYINREMKTRPILTARGPIGQVTRTNAPPQQEVLSDRDAEWKAYIDEKMKTQPILTANGPIYPQRKKVIGRVIRKRRR